MADYDLFNGDADGICALLQLRFAEPRENAELITGVKRDINLLKRVDAKAGDRITVLDVSMDKNTTTCFGCWMLAPRCFMWITIFPARCPSPQR